MDNIYDVIIIGGGPAGISAAYGALPGSTMRTRMVPVFLFDILSSINIDLVYTVRIIYQRKSARYSLIRQRTCKAQDSFPCSAGVLFLISACLDCNIKDGRIGIMSALDFITRAFIDKHVCGIIGFKNAQNCFLMLELADSIHRIFRIPNGDCDEFLRIDCHIEAAFRIFRIKIIT